APPTIPVKSWVGVVADDAAARALARNLRNDVKGLNADGFCKKVCVLHATERDVQNLQAAGLVYTRRQVKKENIIEELKSDSDDDIDSADGDYEDDDIEYIDDDDQATKRRRVGRPPGRAKTTFSNAAANLSVEQAKACSHSRLTLEGEMDAAREKIMRDLVAARVAPPGVAQFGVGPDSTDDESSDGDTHTDKSPSTAQPTALRLSDLGRTDADLSPASEDFPVIVSPKCIKPDCNKSGNLGMVSCNKCEGDLHRGCGVMGGGENDEDAMYDFQGWRCSPCAASNMGKNKPRMPY
ncbi:unnamed protein product, partial [Ectocarpus sp. 4 AP-2014]